MTIGFQPTHDYDDIDDNILFSAVCTLVKSLAKYILLNTVWVLFHFGNDIQNVFCVI